MGERPDVREKRLDLNVPQVAGAALAAVVAAKLASYFGVYGTILGAGLVSVVATCGGSVFQHLFRRTGEQFREATGPHRVERHGPSRPGEFTEGTVYRARVKKKNWKRPLIGAALVFGVTMTGITTYELASGNSFSGGKGTTVSEAVSGDGSSSSGSDDDGIPSTTSTTSPTPSVTPDAGTAGTPSSSASSDGGTTSGATPAPSPSKSSGTPTPTPAPSASGAATTPPAPAASSRSGTGDQDRADPEGQ
ncbi:hypothetical protein DI272_13030 [Streptomyces sp. Act143]|uniref:hypothetical protein n=1 Tax=Streptomyces sp. Act143 TaxID=2200760 RepID=UPI000D67A54F|nr:hypothetical protein [Streptomyces sp. Act143]PWI14988.1 hypothetical protein DI272_13030 [Streptomyces sp. Act143]